jgi:hypothetical protein
MNTLTKTNTCTSQYTGPFGHLFECGLVAGHDGSHQTKEGWGMQWADWVADNPGVGDRVLQEIRERLELDKAEFTSYPYDQSIRDREYLLTLIDGAS